MLLSAEDCLEEVLPYMLRRRHEVLQSLVQVLGEVGLGLELPLQLLRLDEAQAPLLRAAVDLLRCHLLTRIFIREIIRRVF